MTQLLRKSIVALAMVAISSSAFAAGASVAVVVEVGSQQA